ncbi:S8 family peptidase [Roseofilum capinflatum]|uniref:DUF5942 domain-containing protein n=1 Tax=Roseofilum capinflatum BLCC-M114 TaxID=3022440 RepID=A0ABT7B2E1_9CYAN|nr:S8 family peptidase [Roseofilum capinflatum]MDJ1173340.1 DUF5942 domain-containing protein [Roseofilum capinflatum BLCC-M114]
MKKFLLLCLFIFTLGFALFNSEGLATQGTYQSIILDFREERANQIPEWVQTLHQEYGTTPRLNSEFSLDDHVYIVEGDRLLLEQLQATDLKNYTESIEPNYIYQATEIPNDPDYAKQWNLRSINMESAWDDTKGQGVTVAVIDTGITQVPDLKDTKFAQGYDFVNDRIEAKDDAGHGTHVAGTIAQSTNNDYGVAGIAYEAKLMPLKVLGASGGGTVADIAEAIKFAADHEADVINLSLGGAGESALLKEAIDYAYNKGLVVVAAAGNSNQNAASYPARYPHAIGISALDPSGAKAPYSNYGAGVDLSAPGGSEAGKILQNTIDPQTGKAVFEGYQGTSMAAPHVAGVAALIKSVGVEDPEDVLKILKESSRAVEEDPLNHFGAGQLDAGAAVKLALKGQITFKDFFRWLRDNGYLNPRFWIDGGAIALMPKIAMVLGSYLLAWLLRNYFPFAWSGSLSTGLVAGSTGLFFLRGLYFFDVPQWPFRMMGSSIAEWGNVISGSPLLNPIFASVLIPLILVIALLGNPSGKWLAIGTSLGFASFLGISAVTDPAMLWLGSGWPAQLFLGVNALLCFALARLAVTGEGKTA